MRTDLAFELSNILSGGNFKSQVVEKYKLINEKYCSALIINHDEISSQLALQHIQEHINNDINFNEGVWIYDFNIEDIYALNKEVNKNNTVIF